MEETARGVRSLTAKAKPIPFPPPLSNESWGGGDGDYRRGDPRPYSGRETGRNDIAPRRAMDENLQLIPHLYGRSVTRPRANEKPLCPSRLQILLAFG